jgi:uncharacterized protein (UPF0335 family)
MTDAPTTRFAKDHLKAFVERIERLEEEKKAIADYIKDVYAEAKGCGFDTKAIKACIKLRKIDATDRAEQLAVLETYMHALGMLEDIPGAARDARAPERDSGTRAQACATRSDTITTSALTDRRGTKGAAAAVRRPSATGEFHGGGDQAGRDGERQDHGLHGSRDGALPIPHRLQPGARAAAGRQGRKIHQSPLDRPASGGERAGHDDRQRQQPRLRSVATNPLSSPPPPSTRLTGAAGEAPPPPGRELTSARSGGADQMAERPP